MCAKNAAAGGECTSWTFGAEAKTCYFKNGAGKPNAQSSYTSGRLWPNVTMA